MTKHRTRFTRLALLFYLFMSMITCCLQCPGIADSIAPASAFRLPYGVFLSCDASQMDRFADYQTIVIDAAFFDREDIESLQASGHTVYTYLNVGSLETFRPYYKQFFAYTLAPYAHWEEERWMDVSNLAWQAYLCDIIVPDLMKKNVDGFFIDNCDVYYLFPTEPVFQGLTSILHQIRSMGLDVIVNGGDQYVTEYAERFGTLSDILTGVNQESVFGSIDFDHRSFGRASDDDHAYFTAYIERVASLGGKVYLIEYTTDATLIREIAAYCTDMGFTYYLSDSIELD